MKKLNIGSGLDYRKDYINIDFNKNIKADVYLDLNKQKLPFENNTIDHVKCYHVIEHLLQPEKTLQEIQRVLKVNGTAKIILPHYNLFEHHRDLTHKVFATSNSFCNLVQHDCYQTNFLVKRIDWIGKFKSILKVVPLSWLEAIGYPIYQVEFYLMKQGAKNDFSNIKRKWIKKL